MTTSNRNAVHFENGSEVRQGFVTFNSPGKHESQYILDEFTADVGGAHSRFDFNLADANNTGRALLHASRRPTPAYAPSRAPLEQ